jgi:hypothetical protein
MDAGAKRRSRQKTGAGPPILTCLDPSSILRRMRLTVLTLEVANPAAPDQREPVDFLVDSGAVYSFVPRPVLERLGIQAHSRPRFRLADGSAMGRVVFLSRPTWRGARHFRRARRRDAARRSVARSPRVRPRRHSPRPRPPTHGDCRHATRLTAPPPAHCVSREMRPSSQPHRLATSCWPAQPSHTQNTPNV